MKLYKLLAISILLIGCNKIIPHISWDDKKEEKKEIVIATPLKDHINGVYFTFDDGPDLSKTPKILDILKKYNLRATFFVEGINLAGESEAAKERRELLKRMNKEGHIIGNHTYDHKDLCRLTPEKAAWEIDITNKLIIDITGLPNVYLIRPPYGKKCKSLSLLLSKRNMTPVFWQIDPREWERDPKTHQNKNVNQVIDTIMQQYSNLHNDQGIGKMTIILHDTKQITVDLLPELLEKLSLLPVK